MSDVRRGEPAFGSASVSRRRHRLLLPAGLLAVATVATAMSQEIQRDAEPAVPSVPVTSVTPAPSAATVMPPPAVTVVPSPPAPKAAPAKPDNRPLTRPLWHQLTPAQQKALEPLASEWNTLEENRKSKWLAIGNKYHTMQPAEQERIQARMRDWIQLTPEQRRLARESYTRAKKIDAGQKSAKWEAYQQLSDESKKQLADAVPAPTKTPVTTLPSSTAQTKAKTVPPIHSASQPALKESLTPRAVTPPARAVVPLPAAQPAPQQPTAQPPVPRQTPAAPTPPSLAPSTQ